MKSKKYYKIELTRTGYLFIALCLGIGIAALNTGNNLLYLTFGMMLSFIILSGLLSNNTLHGIRLIPHFPKRVFARTALPVRFEILNGKKRFPSFAISVLPSNAEGIRSGGAFALKIPAQSSQTALSHVEFAKRGYQSLPTIRIETSYPFGLLRKYSLQGSEERSLVYPEITQIRSDLGAENQFLGELLTGHRGDSGNPYGIRDFAYGDPYRFIHWRSSAKRGKLRLKEFEDEKRVSIEIDLRLRPEGDTGAAEKRRERAISLAASLIQRLVEADVDVFLRINGETVPGKHPDELFAALALCAPPSMGLDYAALSRESHAIVVSDLPQSALPTGNLLTLHEGNLFDEA